MCEEKPIKSLTIEERLEQFEELLEEKFGVEFCSCCHRIYNPKFYRYCPHCDGGNNCD